MQQFQKLYRKESKTVILNEAPIMSFTRIVVHNKLAKSYNKPPYKLNILYISPGSTTYIMMKNKVQTFLLIILMEMLASSKTFFDTSKYYY